MEKLAEGDIYLQQVFFVLKIFLKRLARLQFRLHKKYGYVIIIIEHFDDKSRKNMF